ncbi:MAG TPA: response regulator transcription factor [Synergistaceae bacterium]|nr:response regulator transcription factor [Synergistaceae bacterium]
MNEHILIVEDDPSILLALEDLLEGEGYRVTVAGDGVAGLEAFRKEPPDMVLLDIMMPRMSGYDLCREIRKTHPLLPLLMLTAKGEEVDKVLGLELGADDYMVKPFGTRELLARIRSALRRRQAMEEVRKKKDAIEEKKIFLFGECHIDAEAMEGTRGDTVFPLTEKELAILQLLAEHPGKAVDRGDMLDLLWGVSEEITTRTVDQHILRLRKKIEEDPGNPKHIITMYGRGYKYVP